MSGVVTRADWLAGIRGGRTDWTGLAERRRLQAVKEANEAGVRYLMARAERDAAAARTREALAEWARLFAKVCEEEGKI